MQPELPIHVALVSDDPRRAEWLERAFLQIEPQAGQRLVLHRIEPDALAWQLRCDHGVAAYADLVVLLRGAPGGTADCEAALRERPRDGDLAALLLSADRNELRRLSSLGGSIGASLCVPDDADGCIRIVTVFARMWFDERQRRATHARRCTAS